MSFNWKKQKGTDIFLREKPIELILCLKQNGLDHYPSILAKDAKCTYSHTVHLLQKMERAGLVKFEKRGRLKLVELTDKGQEVVGLFNDLGDTMVA